MATLNTYFEKRKLETISVLYLVFLVNNTPDKAL